MTAQGCKAAQQKLRFPEVTLVCAKRFECGLLTGTQSAESIMASGLVLRRIQRPDTWQLDQQRPKSQTSCQTGAVHTWREELRYQVATGL